MELTAEIIKKYENRDIRWLRKKAQEKFNFWVRMVERGRACISCGNPNPNQAGHYYSAGHYPVLAFEPDNCHLQCISCNMYKSGNLIEYRKNLIKLIGEERLERLDRIVAQSKVKRFKHDRFSLIETILKYK